MDKNKRRIFVLALVVCCLAMAVTGSLAYYTASEQAHNVITSGSVAIELQELMTDPADPAALIPFEDAEGVMPGAEISKIVQVENTGSADAWVRISLEKAIALVGEGEADLSLLVLDLNEEDWTEQDGYYYYNTALKPGETTTPLFTTVTFAAAMGNEYQNSTATIDVSAQAVQTANNGETALEALGWPEAPQL